MISTRPLHTDAGRARCDVCTRTLYLHPAGTVDQLRARLARIGWSTSGRRRILDRCPDCPRRGNLDVKRVLSDGS